MQTLLFYFQALGISEEIHHNSMNDIDQKVKVKILLAQCLFGNPDVLIMDEPTNDLDYSTVEWLTNFINEFENTVIVVLTTGFSRRCMYSYF